MKEIVISGSKSLSNRYLIVDALYPNSLTFKNLSSSDDTQLLQKALASKETLIDIHHAGTAMRFLTAYFAAQNHGERILTGSDRMKQRPIGDLVTALQSMGAHISYLEKEGYPPLSIRGTTLQSSTVRISGKWSSQYITALCLVGSVFENGLEIEIEGDWVSKPYVEMTIAIQNQLGIPSTIEGNRVIIPHCKSIEKQIITVESDWSSASYLYALSGLTHQSSRLHYYFQNSFQGDAQIVQFFHQFVGVETIFKDNCIELEPISSFEYPTKIQQDLIDTPDIAQTLVVVLSILKIPFEFTGLQTLKVKETDRLLALQQELAKINTKVQIDEQSISSLEFGDIPPHPIIIETYNDHRMAMAFAPLLLSHPNITIQNPEVVSKSFTNFWEVFATFQNIT